MSEARVNNLSNESNTGGPTITGITTFSGTNYFVPPVGNTAQRPENPQKGALRFNTDTKHLEYFKGDTIGWVDVEATNEELNGGHRGVMAGGDNPGSPGQTHTIDYITISTLANAIDFGDLTTGGNAGSGGREYLAMGPQASRTRCLFAGGQGFPSPNNETNVVDYITMASTGNATDYGDLINSPSAGMSCSSETRGVVMGGNDAPTGQMDTIQYTTIASTGNFVDFGGDILAAASNGCAVSSTTRGLANSGSLDVNTMQYITIATTGVDASDFGDFPANQAPRSNQCAGGNATRSVWGGGTTPSPSVNTIVYYTMATLGNGVDFGDLTAPTNGAGAVSSPTRTVFTSGKRSNAFSVTMDYVQIMTTGNAVDFGDSTSARMTMGYGSNGHGGL